VDDSEKPSLPPSLRNLIEQERRRLGPHPPVEDLVAYQAGELPAEQEERLRDHLALCQECARLLLDLREFPDLTPSEGVRQPTPAEVEAAWEALQPLLKEPRPVAAPALRPVEPLKEPAPAQPPRPPERRPSPARWLTPLAAVFFLSTVGLSVWGISLQREIRELRQPGDVKVIDVEDERALPEHEISAAKGTTLRFFPEATEGYSRYELSIQKARTREEVFRGPVSDFTALLPPHYLAPGLYRLTLYGLKNGQDPESLQRLTLRVRPN